MARVGATQLNDAQRRSQMEIDVVGVRTGSSTLVGLIGEAKFHSEPAGSEQLARLERARVLLATRADVEPNAKLAVFSANGFKSSLVTAARGRTDVELIDLERLYTGD